MNRNTQQLLKQQVIKHFHNALTSVRGEHPCVDQVYRSADFFLVSYPVYEQAGLTHDWLYSNYLVSSYRQGVA